MIEVAVFLLATLASVGYFCATVAKRLSPMLRAKERNLAFDRLGMRLWTVFAEVVLQTRVIRERPLAGVLHAL